MDEELTIFISHGNSNLWKDVARFIEHELECEALVLQEQPNRGRTIIEKLEEETQRCHFAIIIMTAEDEQLDGSYRTRQNIVHEIGFCQGVFGRQCVLVLKQNGVQDFANLSGIVYEEFYGNNIKSTFEKIRIELEALVDEEDDDYDQ
jgi:predicted nucleotide-binding protein